MVEAVIKIPFLGITLSLIQSKFKSEELRPLVNGTNIAFSDVRVSQTVYQVDIKRSSTYST